MSPVDAARLGIAGGESVRVSTQRGSTTASVELSDRMQPGHVSLPNGHGAGDEGTPPNELTSIDDRDAFAGTPWHKFVPARIERLPG